MKSIIDKIERSKIAVYFNDVKKLEYFLKCCSECGYEQFETMVVDVSYCYHINGNHLSVLPKVFSEKKEYLKSKGFRLVRI